MPYLPLMVSQQLSSARSGRAFTPRACRGKLLTQAITLKPGTERVNVTGVIPTRINRCHLQCQVFVSVDCFPRRASGAVPKKAANSDVSTLQKNFELGMLVLE